MSSDLSSDLTTLTDFGWSSLRRFRFAVLISISTRETLKPPPVEPAHAPINISSISITFENSGQASKSAVAKPVEVTCKYEDGQIVWVRRTETLRSGEEGLFVLNGCGFIKLYREQTADSDVQGAVRNQPVLFSYNSAYEPITVGAEDSFRICGKILSV